MRQGAEEHHGYVASELFKLSSHRSPVDLFEFFNLYIEMVSKASGIQPYFLGGGVCVCVCVACMHVLWGGLKILISKPCSRSIK